MKCNKKNCNNRFLFALIICHFIRWIHIQLAHRKGMLSIYCNNKITLAVTIAIQSSEKTHTFKLFSLIIYAKWCVSTRRRLNYKLNSYLSVTFRNHVLHTTIQSDIKLLLSFDYFIIIVQKFVDDAFMFVQKSVASLTPLIVGSHKNAIECIWRDREKLIRMSG